MAWKEISRYRAGAPDGSTEEFVLEKDENGQEIVEVGAHRRGIVEELEKAHIYIEQLNNRIKVLEEKLAKLETGFAAE